MRNALFGLMLAFCWMPLAAGAAPAASLDEIVSLARGGAPGIALRLLDEYQAEPELARGDWLAAERERLHILAGASDWQALAGRVADLPADLPGPFLDWAAERRAEALLYAGDGHGAREVLQRLVWGARAPDDDVLRAWRMLIVRSYLADDDRGAALVALQRYAQDYGRDDPVLRALHGEILLDAGRDREAFEALGDSDEPLRWLAALRADALAPGAVFERMVQRGSARATLPATRRAAWRVAAEAAQRMGNSGAVVAALERALRTSDDDEPLPPILEAAPADLWAAYREWGRALGNASHLIVGVDGDWLDTADRRTTDEPAQARALYASLAHDTYAPATADTAHARFAALLAAEPGGERVLAALYLNGGLFDDPASLPAAVRYLLLDEVLRRGDLDIGARLVADLDAPPAGADATDWQVRRARVLVLGGRREDAEAALHALLDETTDYDVDRLLQVLFDLQSAGAHETALPLFARVYGRDGLEVQARREILFWMAESRQALGDHADAARLYLRSAMLDDPHSMDHWAQTARYQAADALVQAGLYPDALSQLQSLLNAAPDAARRALLQARIDELTRPAARGDG